MKDNFNFTFANDPEPVTEGMIVSVNGKRHKVSKVTTTAIAATRYYWFDAIYDWFKGKLGLNGQTN